MDETREPVQITFTEEQRVMYGSLAQQAGIRNGDGRDGGRLSHMIAMEWHLTSLLLRCGGSIWER